MSAQHAEHPTSERFAHALVFVLQATLWLSMAYWALQFVFTLWRWALGYPLT